MNEKNEQAAANGSNLDLLKDIELAVTLRFGRTRMTLEKLVRLNTGSIVEFEGAADDPVELLVNGRLIARGEAVIVQNCYGIRISEIAGSQDRLFSAATGGAIPAADAAAGGRS